MMKKREHRKEVKEAIAAADEVIKLLDKAKRSLNTAQGLGIVDLLGGKTFVTFIKQTRINKAERDILNAQRAIKRMNEEILDVKSIIDVDLEMGVVLKLADYFFGGPVADWLVLGRIGEAKMKISKAKKEVLEVRNGLERLW